MYDNVIRSCILTYFWDYQKRANRNIYRANLFLKETESERDSYLQSHCAGNSIGHVRVLYYWAALSLSFRLIFIMFMNIIINYSRGSPAIGKYV